MEHTIDHRPSFAQLTVELDADEQFVAEAGALVEYAGDVDVSTGARGGVLGSLERATLGGEPFFMNTVAENELAPSRDGDRPGETHVVDTGHVVAFDPDADWRVKRVGGLTSTG